MTVTLVLGGARSGKSRFAENLALTSGKRPVYVATAEPRDGEMTERIKQHQKRRGSAWQIWEEPFNLVSTLEQTNGQLQCVLVDCVTLWLSNLLLAGRDIVAERQALLAFLEKICGDIIFVSNEVGLGIVPDNALARQFRDHAGETNQTLAALADKVYFIAAGLPLTLKG